MIEAYQLPVPLPREICLISAGNKKYASDGWKVFSAQYQPGESLYKQLVFALKYEGINLLVFKKLFRCLSQSEIVRLLGIEPAGQYSRRIWFLYEWLFDNRLPLADADVKIGYVPVVDEKNQYGMDNGERSRRHRIVNNLPGLPGFCPLVSKTVKLTNYQEADLAGWQNRQLKRIHRDLLQRTAAFLLLQDSRASFTIEGEHPRNRRAARWGRAIGQAGTNPLSEEELLRLQQLVIEDTRFVNMGFRREGGFVGDHDRTTGEPLPEHISARWQDVKSLVGGLIAANHRLESASFDAVIAAAMVAFGFVFIHPFQDGNGRIHRYIIHHTLARKHFAQQGVIFPVSASILNHIEDYRAVLQTYSQPLLDHIEWRTTPDNNIEVTNDTADYNRYFDATPQAEFLYDCVHDTIQNIIPQEVRYLEQYDRFKRALDTQFEMPDKTVALLLRFLQQNEGKLSKRARHSEFRQLKAREVEQIESWFRDIFDEA